VSQREGENQLLRESVKADNSRFTPASRLAGIDQKVKRGNVFAAKTENENKSLLSFSALLAEKDSFPDFRKMKADNVGERRRIKGGKKLWVGPHHGGKERSGATKPSYHMRPSFDLIKPNGEPWPGTVKRGEGRRMDVRDEKRVKGL